MGYFKDCFGKVEGFVEQKEKFTQNKVKRAFGATEDKLSGRIIDIEEELTQARIDFSNGKVEKLSQIIGLQVEKKYLSDSLEILQAEQKACLEE